MKKTSIFLIGCVKGGSICYVTLLLIYAYFLGADFKSSEDFPNGFDLISFLLVFSWLIFLLIGLLLSLFVILLSSSRKIWTSIGVFFTGHVLISLVISSVVYVSMHAHERIDHGFCVLVYVFLFLLIILINATALLRESWLRIRNGA